MIVVELIVGVAIIVALIRTRLNCQKNYTVYFTTGNIPGKMVRTEWCIKSCPYEEFEHDCEQLFSIAVDSYKNRHFRELGYTGIAIVDADSGFEDSWCYMVDKNYS